MTDRQMFKRAAALALGGLLAAAAGSGLAFDFGNMMNPSKWMGGNNNDRDYYEDGPWGGGPGYGYGGPGYGGPGYGGPGYGYGGPGYGGPGYGYGGPGYGAPGVYGAPGYGGPAQGQGYAPTETGGYAPAGSQSEVDALKARLRALEGGGVQ